MDGKNAEQHSRPDEMEPHLITAALTEAQNAAAAILLAAQDRAVAVLLEAQDRAAAVERSAATRGNVTPDHPSRND